MFKIKLDPYYDTIRVDTENPEARDAIVDAGWTLTVACHGLARQAGWWNDLETGAPLDRNVSEMLMLSVSELAEANESVRKGTMDDHLPHRPGVEVELADAIIRCLDLGAGMGLDVPGALAEKLRYNANRADHKRENRLKPGGKKF